MSPAPTTIIDFYVKNSPHLFTFSKQLLDELGSLRLVNPWVA